MNRITLHLERLLGSEFGRIVFDIARTALDLEDLIDDLATYGEVEVEEDVSMLRFALGDEGEFLALARGRFDAESLYELLEGEFDQLEEVEYEGRDLLTDGSMSIVVLGDVCVVGLPATVERCIEVHAGVRMPEPKSLEAFMQEIPTPRGDLEVNFPNLGAVEEDEGFAGDLPGVGFAGGLGVESIEGRVDLQRGIEVEASADLGDAESAAAIAAKVEEWRGRLRDHGAVKTMGLRDLVDAVQIRQRKANLKISIRISEHRTWMLLSLGDLAKGFLKRGSSD